MIPYGRQHISQDDIDAVIDVLKSDFLTQGPAVANLEKDFAKFCGAKYAVAVNSATSGLHIGAMALGLEEGGLLWTSPITFVATANAGRYCGADVDFVDIDPDTMNISVDALGEKLIAAKKAGRLPDIVVPVHFSGYSCDMKAIHDLAKEYGFRVMEDAAHSVGASCEGLRVGACQFSDLAVFSTHPVKIITSGEGGVITTNDEGLYQKLIRLRTHGITKDQDLMRHDPHGPWYFEQHELGYNYRMSDIHAALGRSQLKKADQFVAKRRALAANYHDMLKPLPLDLPLAQSLDQSSWHLYVVRLKPDKISRSQTEVFSAMRQHGIGVNLHYIPVHLHPYYQEYGFKQGDFPLSEAYYATAMSIPLFSAMTDEDQNKVVSTLAEVLG
jgi:UDP-4-amino-4,6-dideoxy-N-acetyl-beta-L-altrosamine transaminase